ncbi:MAG: hypothetical protein PHH13_01380 [Candidatus Peribacteraceae bacterium]|nr:hypothetical protein [Candidatus Peribacteraceae bacterium]
MKIGIVGSMHFTEQMMDAKEKLLAMGHDAFVTSLAPPFVGLSDDEKEKRKIEDQMERDAIREFWRLMQGADAILVMNFDRRGIKNYIGGNTLLEMGFAHILDQQIYLLNPIPDIPYYRQEIVAMRPIVLNGDLTRIR